MAIAVIANTAKGSVNQTSVTTDAIDTTGATLLVIVVSFYGSSSTISDSKGNTWNARTSYGGAGNSTRIYYAVNPTVGTGHTFTASGVTNFPAIFVIALSGAHLTTPYDVENGATGSSSTTIATGSVTPSENNEILIAGLTLYPAGTETINSGFTIANQLAYVASNSMGGALAYEIQTTATARNPTWTHSVTGTELTAAIATFKAAAVAGGTRGMPFGRRGTAFGGGRTLVGNIR